jgi:hypothetical protein
MFRTRWFATALITVAAAAPLGFAANSWSAAQQHAHPYDVGPLQKCLARKGFRYVRHEIPVNHSGVAGKSAWYTRDKHSITVIVMVTPSRAVFLRHQFIVELARERHLAQTKVERGVRRRGDVVWQSFKLTALRTRPVATTPTDMATLAACLPPKT